MVSDLPTTVVLHLGAHKTASTHLQHAIMAAMPLPGVAFWGPRHLRDRGGSLPERFGFPLDPDNSDAPDVPPDQMLQTMADGAKRLVLSDETFAGKLQTGWGRIPTPLYFTAPARVATLAQAIADAGGPALTLCLGIRDPAAYLTSAYSQILHGKRVIRPEKFREKNPLEAVDWADYVARLRAVPGVNHITVWQQDAYSLLFSSIVQAMIGSHPASVTPGADRTQQRLSDQAVKAVLLAKDLSLRNVAADAAQAFPVTPENPPFALYAAADQTRSDALYTAQCDAIARMPDVTLLRVPPT